MRMVKGRLPAALVRTVCTVGAALLLVAGLVAVAPASVSAVEPDECTVLGSEGADVIEETNGDDVICGLGGNDVIHSGNGNDVVYGGDGDDLIHAGNGNDVVYGGDGNDSVFGKNGNDVIDGGPGADQIDGKNGVDSLVGGSGDDVLTGGNGNDALAGKSGNDVLDGGKGDDGLTGGLGNDAANGDKGRDSCAAEETEACEESPHELATTLPNLSEGQHLGFKSFSPIEPEDAPLVEELTDEAVAAGLDVGRIFYDWFEVEPALGDYQFDALREELAAFEERGQQPIVALMIGVGDDGPLVPAELAEPFPDSDTPLELRSDLTLDSPEVIDNYLAMLDTILPELIEANVWALTLSNEPDTALSDMSPAEAEETGRQLANFMSAVREHVHAVDPSIAITFTMSGPAIIAPPPGLDSLLEVSDIVSANFGCLDLATFDVHSEFDHIARDLSALRDLAGGKQIVLQEVSCHSGPLDGESVTGSSPAYQAAWFEAFYAEMAAIPEIRAAFILDLVDWPDWLVDLFIDILFNAGLEEIAEKYGELLATWGLVTFDLEEKPAWDSFLAELEREAALRTGP